MGELEAGRGGAPLNTVAADDIEITGIDAKLNGGILI